MTQVLVVVNARLRDATFLPTGDPAVSWSQGCSSELSAGKAGDSLRDFDTFLSFTISGGLSLITITNAIAVAVARNSGGGEMIE